MATGDIATVVVLYAAAGALWILLSDALLLLADDAKSAAMISVFKGLGFVGITSLLLYLVLRRFGADHAAGLRRVGGDAVFERIVQFTVIVFVVVIVSVGYLRARAVVDADNSQALAQLSAVAQREALDVETWLASRRREASMLAEVALASIDSADTPGDLEAAARAVAPLATNFERLRLVAPDSRIAWASDGAPGAYAGETAVARALFEQAVHMSTHGTDVDFAAPVGSRGVVILSVPLRTVSRLAAEAQAAYGEGARTRVFRRDGETIAYLDGTRTSIAESPTPEALALSSRNEFDDPLQGVDDTGRRVVSVVRPLRGPGDWHFSLQVDKELLDSKLGRNLSWISGAVAVALILPLAGGLLLTQRRRLQLMQLIDHQREERVALVRHYDTLVQKARDIILLIDEEDRIVDANEAARQEYGYSLEELQRMTIQDLIASDRQDNSESWWHRAGEPEDALFESRHRRRDGSAFPVEVSLRTLGIEGRQYRQAFIRDISRRHDDQASIERRARLHLALGDCNQAIIRSRNRDTLFAETCRALVETGGMAMAWVGVIDRKGDRILPVAAHGAGADQYAGNLDISLNPGGTRGRGPTATCVREDRAVWSDSPGGDVGGPNWRVSAALPIHERGRVVASINVYSTAPDGFNSEERELMTVMADDLGAALDYLATLKVLRESEERWGSALEGSAEGVWDRRIDTDEVYFSSLWKHMLGYGESDVGTKRSEWRERVHPDDLPRVEADVDAHLRGESEYFVSEYRMRGASGEYVWILDRGKVIVRDESGRPLRMVGTHSDITERKAIEQKLREQARILETSQRIAHVGTWHIDAESATFHASSEALRIHGTDEKNFAGTRGAFVELVHPEDRRALTEWLDGLADAAQGGEIEYRTASAGRRVHCRGAVRDDADGSRLVGTVQDVTEWRSTEAREKEQLDELRRWYEITLEREERIMDLKQEVNLLLARLDQPARYQSAEIAP